MSPSFIRAGAFLQRIGILIAFYIKSPYMCVCFNITAHLCCAGFHMQISRYSHVFILSQEQFRCLDPR